MYLIIHTHNNDNFADRHSTELCMEHYVNNTINLTIISTCMYMVLHVIQYYICGVTPSFADDVLSAVCILRHLHNFTFE